MIELKLKKEKISKILLREKTSIVLDHKLENLVLSLVDGKEYCTVKLNEPYLMNLELNFVCNNRFLKGDYKTAILYFEHVTNKYPDHAFGHYYLAKSYEKLDDYRDKAKFYSDKFYEIINISNEWKEYAEYFKLI